MTDENLKTRLENSLVSNDESKDNLKQINCLVGAIYQLSVNYYLKRHGLSPSDLDKKELAHFRRLNAWPSQSKFVFSLEQMRDAFEELAKNTVASQLMSTSTKEDALARKKTKTEFWSILGEGPTVEESFKVLENDKNTSAEELNRIRLLAYAFRLVLFQKKITQFRETGNFLELLNSANKALAQEAFRHCVGIVPFSQDFMGGGEGEEREEEVAEEVAIEKEKSCGERAVLQSLIKSVSLAINEFEISLQRVDKVADMIQKAIEESNSCADFKEEDFFNVADLI